MKGKLIYLFLLANLFDIGSANAWVFSEGVTISSMTQWQDNSPIYFGFSNGVACYLPADEKNMYSMMLSAFIAGKPMQIYCHDSEEQHGGLTGHRVHRIHLHN